MPYIDQITRGGTTYDIQDSATKAVAEAIPPMIAYEELTKTATHAYTAGNSYFILGGVLYKATADIAVGDTIATTGTGANAAQVPGGVTGDVADLKSAFNNEIYDENADILIQYSIASTGKWSKKTSDVAYLVRCNPGDSLVIDRDGTGNVYIYYTLLKTANMVNGETPDYATGYDNAVMRNVGTQGPLALTIPEDAHFVWVVKTDSGISFAPDVFTLNEFDMFKTVRGNICETNTNVGILGTNLQETNESVGQLSNQVYGSDVDCLSMFRITAQGEWAKQSYNCAYIIPCEPEDVFVLAKSGTVYCYYAVIESLDNMAAGNDVDFATGYSGFLSFRNGEISVSIPSDGHYLWVYKTDNTNNYAPDMITLNGLNALKTLRRNVVNAYTAINTMNGRIDELAQSGQSVQYSLGGIDELSPYDGTNLKYAERIAGPRHEHRYAVTVNHDDLQKSDYINTRKVYNKFGFRGNFNFILLPFANAAEMSEKTSNVRKMIAEGHCLGLHAIFSESFWWLNKLFDVRPDSSFTFAPTLAELTTDVESGLNVFGVEIDTTKPLSYYKFVNCPNTTAVGSLTSTDYAAAVGYYTWLFNASTFTGLDLDGNTQTGWRWLKWLEYWYNSLIDDTMGYTDITDTTVAGIYANNYTFPSGGSASGSYPDVDHLKNGKMVFFDDTGNPHYSDADYQKVGYFAKGLFKGKPSCCNYEVRERCIQIARAFCQHYFGSDIFNNYGQHGVSYVNLFWKTVNQYDQAISYENRDKTILAGMYGKTYNMEHQAFETGMDILKRQGIKMTNHAVNVGNSAGMGNPIYEAQWALYKGQDGKRSPFFAFSELIQYLTIMGTSAGHTGSTDSAKVIKILSEHKGHEIQYIYENVGQQVSSADGTVTLYVHPYLKQAIDIIRGAMGTGKIPFFSLDTIMNDASNIYAVELLSRYCWYSDVEIMPVEEARTKALRDNWTIAGNYFPNPTFNQSLLKLFGGDSTAKDAYRPDGWVVGRDNGSIEYSVDRTGGVHKMSVTASGTGVNKIYTRMWGLPAGEYQLKFTAKSTGSHGVVDLRSYKNGDNLVGQSFNGGTSILSQALTETDTEYTKTFTIPEPYNTVPIGDADSVISDGYENNVVEIKLLFGFEFGSSSQEEETVSIHDVKLVRI